MTWLKQTVNGKTIYRYGRARAESPGKHGDKDFAVYLGDLRPTSQEALFMLAMINKAQWDCFQARERDELWIGGWAREAVECRSLREIQLLVEKNHLLWELHRAQTTRIR